MCLAGVKRSRVPKPSTVNLSIEEKGVQLNVKKPLGVRSVIEVPWDFSEYEYRQSKLSESDLRKEGKACPRWTADTKTIYVFDFDVRQEYLTKRLDLAIHYQIAEDDWPNFKKAMQALDTSRKKSPTSSRVPTVKFITRDSRATLPGAAITRVPSRGESFTFEDDFLKINYSPQYPLPKKALEQAIKALGKKVSERGNLARDFGETGTRNQLRKKEWMGLAGPNQHKDSNLPWVKELFQFTSARFKAMAGGGFCPDIMGTEKPDRRTKKRWRMFAKRYGKDNILESIRIAVTDASVVASDHGDRDNDDTEERYMPSGAISFHFQDDDGKVWRFAIIGYMKKSVAAFLDKLELYGDLIGEISQYYRANLKEHEEDRTAPKKMLFPPSKGTGDAPQLVRTMEPCLDKIAGLYSSYDSAIIRLIQKYMVPKLPDSRVFSMYWLRWMTAIVICTSFSHCPAHFWYLCLGIEKDEKYLCEVLGKRTIPPFGSLKPEEVCGYMTDAIWIMKAKGAEDHIPHPATPRHQPAANTKPSPEKLRKSINYAVDVLLMLRWKLPPEADLRGDRDMRFYYELVIAKLCQNNDSALKFGVYGCGGLTSQHFLAINSILSLADERFLRHAEVPKSTLVADFLRDQFGFAVWNHEEECRELLSALSHLLDLSVAQCEELVCRFVKHKNKERKQGAVKHKKKQQRKEGEASEEDKYEEVAKYRDSVFPGQHKFQYCPAMAEKPESSVGDEPRKKKARTEKVKATRSDTGVVHSYYTPSGKLVVMEPFQVPYSWPSEPTLDMQERLELYDNSFWEAKGLGRPLPPRKQALKQQKLDVSYMDFFPTLCDKKGKVVAKRPAHEVKAETLVLPSKLDIWMPQSSFAGRGDDKLVDLSSIVKAAFGYHPGKQPNDREIIRIDRRSIDGIKFFSAGLYVGGNSFLEPHFPDASFPLRSQEWVVQQIEGRLWFRTPAYAKQFLLHYYVLTFSVTCLGASTNNKKALIFLAMPAKSKPPAEPKPAAKPKAAATKSKAAKPKATVTRSKLPAAATGGRSARTRRHTEDPNAEMTDIASMDTTQIDYARVFSIQSHNVNERSRAPPPHPKKKKKVKKKPDGIYAKGVHKPMFVCVRYRQGGYAHYLVNGDGVRTSDIYITWPGRCVAPFRSTDLVIKEDGHEKYDAGDTRVQEFLRIVGHMGSGGTYKIQIQWASGTLDWISLQQMIQKAPLATYRYAKAKDLLDTGGWKRLKSIGRKAEQAEEMKKAQAAQKNATKQDQSRKEKETAGDWQKGD